MIRMLILLPVWFLTLLLKPLLPAAHPWKHQRLTLRSWCEKGTDNAIQFGLGFWLLGLCQAVAIYIVWLK